MKQSETVGKKFETSQKASTLLRSLLPAAWLFREQNPDVHIDFVVEIVEGAQPTGINFGVQLKGTQPKKGTPLSLRYRLKKKHLRYYCQKATLPVFLVLADVTHRKAHWCFTQQFARKFIDPERLKTNGAVSIRFAESDCLDDLPRFRDAVQSAIDYMKDLYPGSILAAIESRKAKLRETDPRVNVSIDVTGGHEHFTITANQQFEFKMKVTGEDTPEFNQALLDFLEKGTELKVNPSALQFEGAPLLSRDFPASDDKGYIKMQFSHDVAGTLQVFEVGGSLEFLFQIDGNFRCGTKFATFEGTLPGSALIVTTSVSFEGLLKGEQHNFGLSFRPGKWGKQPLTQLSNFEPVYRFMKNLHENRTMRIKFLHLGNDLLWSDFSGLDPQHVADMFNILELLHKARFIAHRFTLNPSLPPVESITGTQAKSIDDVYDLLHQREARMPRPNFRFAFKISGQSPVTATSKSGILRVRSPQFEFDIFGSKISLGPINHFFTGATVASATPLPDGRTDIVITGEDESEWIIQLEGPAIK